MSDNKALFLSDILATAWFAVDLAKVSDGDTVAIWGAGPGTSQSPSSCDAHHSVLLTPQAVQALHAFASLQQDSLSSDMQNRLSPVMLFTAHLMCFCVYQFVLVYASVFQMGTSLC